MNNLKAVSPDSGGTMSAFLKIIWLYTLSFVPAGIGLYLYLPAPSGLGLLNMWVAMPLIIAGTLLVLKLTAFGTMKEGIAKQFEIFRNKHTWSMTLLYIVTFGSFIGFSMALPLSIKVIFGISHVPDAGGVMQHTLNTRTPAVLAYVWTGSSRADPPAGRLDADKVGGSIVPRHPAVMVVAPAMVGCGCCWPPLVGDARAVPRGLHAAIRAAVRRWRHRQRPTFRSIEVIFDRTQAGPVLGWTSAIAAYGAFIAPVVIGAQIQAGTPELAMYGFAVFYALCLVLNWWFYLRPNASVKNP
jgi:NNP family nitrate/nitrite transporter-like MFS transporter